MQFEPTSIEGVALVRLPAFRDERGSFTRTFCAAAFRAAGSPFEIVQASTSRNTARHTLRGLHYQREPHGEGKVVRCARGRIWDVAVDLRSGSPSYRCWQGFPLAEDDGTALLLPRGIAHGFLTLEPDCEVQYLMDQVYVPEAAAGLRYDDPAIGIRWPAPPAVISAKDLGYPLL